jgi:phosphotransferase system HPr (HPr) family protein
LNKHEGEVMVANKHGLHARPATLFAQTANKFEAAIEVSNGDLTVDAKSVMSVLRLGAACGTLLRIRAKGADAAKAVQALTDLVAGKFGEA